MNIILILIICPLLILIDQISKYLAYKNLQGKVIKFIPDIIEFLYVENRGAAFGILQNAKIFFIIITIIFLIVSFYYFFKLSNNKINYFIKICLIIVISGALGNFIDRLFRGFVIDFIYFKPINFPVFNFADSYIVIGTFLLFISTFIYGDKNG